MQRGGAGSERQRAFLRHPSVRALLDADGTTQEPDVAMRRRARDLVERALRKGWEGPPFDLEILASLRGYRVEYTEALGEGQDGCIDAGSHRRIRISTRLPRVRQRFTIAHEIAHTLLPDFGTGAHHHDARAGYEWAQQSPIEQLCQIGAAELLLPLAPFHAACGDEPASVSGILRVAEQFDASFEAVARHWILLSPPSSSLVMVRSVIPPMAGVASPGLEVFHAMRGGGRPIYLAKGSTTPRDSVVECVWDRAYTTEERPCREEAIEDWTHLNGLGRCHVEAVTLPLNWEMPESILCLLHGIQDTRTPTTS